MEVSSQDVEIPIPINSSYGGHMIHHHDPALLLVVPHSHTHTHTHNNIGNLSPQSHLLPSSNGQSNVLIPTATATATATAAIATATSLTLDHHHDHDHGHSTEVIPYSSKKVVGIKYRECLKNHAAAMGGTATDGCGEFMPSGEEGTIEALTCSACNCHRNFHRKEVEGDPCDHFYHHISSSRRGRKLILGHHKCLMGGHADALPLGLGYPTATGTLISSRGAPLAPPHHQMIMPSAYNMNMNMGSYQMGSDQSDEQDQDGGVGICRPRHQHQQLVKKRFRTKFSQEQKDKMLNFAEKVGWRIQKQEESVVQQFCQEIGVKRRVLKVWMHNNKHTLAKKHLHNPISIPSTTTAADATSLD